MKKKKRNFLKTCEHKFLFLFTCVENFSSSVMKLLGKKGVTYEKIAAGNDQQNVSVDSLFIIVFIIVYWKSRKKEMKTVKVFFNKFN
jgi:hypothetical protein